MAKEKREPITPGEITPATLDELALNLRSSWNHRTDELWARLDPELWALTHNPWAVLQTVSRARLTHVLSEPEYRARVQDLLRRRHEYLTAAGWLQESHPGTGLTGVAYFSMEFGLSEALPLYAGGLGNVAGDQLKAASDLGVPVIGVGLLYQQGYFRQAITADRRQEALYTYNDPGQLPIRPVQAALAATRAGNVFTTHTAVPAGFDRFAPALVAQYLRPYAEQSCMSPSTRSWPWAGRTPATRMSPSTWPFSPCEAAARRTA